MSSSRIHQISILFTQVVTFLFCDFEVEGRENIPTTPCIITSNHMSHFDGVAAIAAARKVIPTLAARKHRGNFIGWVMRCFTSPIWIDQQSPDLAALKKVFQLLQNGSQIGIAPEGTRSRTHTLQQGLKGAAYIVRKAHLPVLPMALIGTENITRQSRPKITVRIGKSYHLSTEETLEESTDRIMCAIAALMPACYHGFYQDHPFIQEMNKVVT